MGDEDGEDGDAITPPVGETPSGEAEQLFGVNLRSLREARGMSQVRFAEEMTARGWAWRQQTVTRVETGRRMVRWGEAHAAAAILGVTTDRFSWTTQEAGEVMLISATHGRLREAWREVADSAARLHAARNAAERSVTEYQGSKYERVRDSVRGLSEDLKSGTLEAALDEAEALWQRLKRGEA